MKIREIKISNIMSFPFVEDLPASEGIQFPASENKTDLNILIGANGSGKSNFIEIINQFVRNMVFDYTFDPALLQSTQKADQQQAIKFLPKRTTKLSKHSRTQNLPARVEITIELFQNDFENIGFACKYADKLNEIIEKYSESPYRFPNTSIEDIQRNVETIHICAEFSEKDQMFIIDQSKLSPQELFALVCIQEQELLYICIRIFNQFKKNQEADNERMRYPLKNTFSVVSSERDMNKLKYLNNCHEFDTYIFQEKNEKDQNLEGFYKVLHKIRTIINKNSQEILLNPNAEIIDENIENRLYNSNFWKRMTKSIKRFINKDLFIEYIQGELSLKLKNDKGDRFYFSDLSAGQQAILLILFAIYGNDLRDGFMIIDEPELHTHPQLQKELALLLNQISQEKGTQFFLSTYSALFINEENIINVYRFQNENTDETHIFNPRLQIASDDAKLVHLLRFENLSKIFFVDKIILVEGDSDLYFFSHYLKRLQDQPGREEIVGTYELININGKGSYNSWHKFLNKFWIQNYFIGDRDNTVDYGFFTQKEINKYYQLANRHMKNYQGRGEGWDYYNRLVYAIKKYYPQKFKKIIEGIEDLYNDNIFILKLGAIESYPGLERKGLQYMVNFANYEFFNWLADQKFLPQRKELEEIFGCIFEKGTKSWIS